MSVELTPAQARALADLAARDGSLNLHQLVGELVEHGPDVYATPIGTANGYRIAADGTVSSIGHTLPAGLSIKGASTSEM
jgi:hypothetical protein